MLSTSHVVVHRNCSVLHAIYLHATLEALCGHHCGRLSMAADDLGALMRAPMELVGRWGPSTGTTCRVAG